MLNTSCSQAATGLRMFVKHTSYYNPTAIHLFEELYFSRSIKSSHQGREAGSNVDES